MLQEHLAGPKNAPMAVKTVFGWAILGKTLPHNYQQSINASTPVEVSPIDDLRTHFGEIEEPPNDTPIFTPDEESVQRHFSSSHIYVSQPRYYQISLPSVSHHTALGLSRPQALHLYLYNEKALIKKGIMMHFRQLYVST